MEYDGLSDCLQLSALPDPKDKFVLEGLIAEGAYGAVYEAADRWKASLHVAVKVVPHISRHITEIEQEYRTLTELSGNAHFPEFFGLFLNKPDADPGTHEIWFAMELMELGSVGELTRRCSRRCQNIHEDLICYILASAVKGLCHLYSKHNLHRDVKCDNLLITATGGIKICDFGQVGYLSSTLSRRNTCVGSVCWVAPEVIACRGESSADYDLRCDVWSLGISAIELCEGAPPLSILPPVRALFHIAHNPPPSLTRPGDWSPDLRDFVSECLVKNPDHRPHMEELLEHPSLSLCAGEDTTQVSERLVETCMQVAKTSGSGTPVGPTNIPQALTRRGFIRKERLERSEKLVVEDLATLEDYNEQVVVEVLQERWQSGQLYTWLADILVAVNTNTVKHAYDDKTHALYQRRARSDNAPHIFAVADKAHQDLLHHKEAQTIVLTGESGAGKSFSFQRVVDHLCYLGARHQEPIRRKIAAVVTVLDALGNASTELNPSATRHTRLVELLFSPSGRICGLHLTVTMVERLRLTSVTSGESNYHLLYHLYDGLSQSGRLKHFGLSVGRQYTLLAKHDQDNEVANAKKLGHMEAALMIIGFSSEELKTAYHVLAAILHLGNVQFKKGDSTAVVDHQPVKEAARQLSVDERKLLWALCHRCCEGEQGNISPGALSSAEAAAARDALVQALYSRLLDTVVELVNAKMAPKAAYRKCPRLAINVLDMPGFEATEHNGLQQMLVNVLNEQLQYYYNQVLFTWEMNDYEEEGVSGTGSFSFPDNRHLLELFLAQGTGLLHLLEEGRGGGDAALEDKLNKRADGRLISRMARNNFAIAHYVGRVKYDLQGMMEKNRDHITPELVHTLRASSLPLVSAMFSAQITRSGQLPPYAITSRCPKAAGGATSPDPGPSSGKRSQSRHTPSQGIFFRHALIALLYKLTHSTPHFVRCIRGNMEESDTFDIGMVRHQVKYHALCDTITIRQQGFSHRLPFQDFLKRYQCLAFDFDETVEETANNARLLLLRLKMEGWAIGSGRVFLKYYMEEYLSRLYEDHLRKVVKIQAMIRTYVQLKRIRAGHIRARSQRSSPEQAEMTRKVDQTAANKIANRDRFNEDCIDGEAARIVQYYFRKWKLRSLFQTLQIYRADKMKQLVYFCQQVHLFSQECQSRAINTSLSVDLAQVVPQEEGSHRTLLSKHTFAQPPKLALDHTLASFFDTSYLCHPSRNFRQQDDDWEGPFKRLQASQRAANMGSGHPLPSMKPVPPITTDYSALMATTPPTTSPQQDNKDHFKDLKQQILTEKQSSVGTEKKSNVTRERSLQLTSCSVSQQTSFDRQENNNTPIRIFNENNNNNSYIRNVNGGYDNDNNSREVVYKSKRSESRESTTINNIFPDYNPSSSSSQTSRNSYNRFAAVPPGAQTTNPVYSHYNISYIKPVTRETPPSINATNSYVLRGGSKAPVIVASWQDRNRGSRPSRGGGGGVGSHNTPQAALYEMQVKAERYTNTEASAFQGKLRKTNYTRNSMKRDSEVKNDNYSPFVSENRSSNRPSQQPFITAVPTRGDVKESSKRQPSVDNPPKQPFPPLRGGHPSLTAALQKELSRESERSEQAERYMRQASIAVLSDGGPGTHVEYETDGRQTFGESNPVLQQFSVHEELLPAEDDKDMRALDGGQTFGESNPVLQQFSVHEELLPAEDDKDMRALDGGQAFGGSNPVLQQFSVHEELLPAEDDEDMRALDGGQAFGGSNPVLQQFSVHEELLPAEDDEDMRAFNGGQVFGGSNPVLQQFSVHEELLPAEDDEDMRALDGYDSRLNNYEDVAQEFGANFTAHSEEVML